MPQDKHVTLMIEAAQHLGPFRRHPAGELYAYSHPERAEPGEPRGIYVPAEDVLRRYLTQDHAEIWSPSRRTAVLDFFRDASYTVLTGDITSPLIPTLTGVLDMTPPTDEGPGISPHSPHYGFTSQLPHHYRSNAECPNIDEFLSNALPTDAIPIFWEMLGYSFLPYQFLRKAVMLVGPSGTGKSTLLYIIEKVLGPSNCSFVPLQAFSTDKFASAHLFGKLANIGGDLDATEVENTGAFKSLTGDDLMRADVKYGKPIAFRSFATQWYAANSVPPSRDHSDAWRSRWVTLPLDRKPAKPDVTLRSKVTTEDELEGAVKRAIDHLSGVLLRGSLSWSESIQHAGDEFHRQTDHIQEYLHNLKESIPGQFRTRSALWAGYKAWASDEGVNRIVRKSILFQRISEEFGTPIKKTGEFGWTI